MQRQLEVTTHDARKQQLGAGDRGARPSGSTRTVQIVSRDAVARLPRRHQASLRPVRPVARLSRLGDAAGPVPPLSRAPRSPRCRATRWRPTWRTTRLFDRRGPVQPVDDVTHWPSSCAVRWGCRPGSSPEHALGAARQSVERQPPSHRGVHRPRGRVAPLRAARACPRAAGALPARRRGPPSAAAATALLVGADVDPLARGVEVRRAGVPLLPARSRARDRGAAAGGGAARLAAGAPAAWSDPQIATVLGTRSRWRLRRRRAGGAGVPRGRHAERRRALDRR